MFTRFFPRLDAALICGNFKRYRLAVLPLFIVAEDLRAGRLIHVLPRETPVPDAIYAVYPQRRHKLRRLSVLVEHLRSALAGVPPWERDLSTR